MTSSVVLFILSCTDTEKNYNFGGGTTESDDATELDSASPEEDTSVQPQDTRDTYGRESCDELSIPETVTIEDCTVAPETGMIAFEEEWWTEEFLTFPEYNHILSTPIVAQLTDDNADGVIDSLDTLDIVFIADDGGLEAQTHGVLRIISEGEFHNGVGFFESDGDQAYPYRYSGIAVGDINSDGWPEIVGITQVIPGVQG